ncbi:MAG: hypothetical protein IJL74_02485 [Bacilli bacterium]|nr:hypothetical protein [Bacilli bacterium]
MFNILDLVTPPTGGGTGIIAAIAAVFASVGIFIKSLFKKNKKNKKDNGNGFR